MIWQVYISEIERGKKKNPTCFLSSSPAVGKKKEKAQTGFAVKLWENEH